jgi:hypothetical protein
MRIRSASAIVGVCMALATTAVAQPVRVGLDQETTVGGIPVGCTGIGQTKNDPKWKAYSVRVEFADAAHAYLADEALNVSDASGAPVLDVSCEGPWILLGLPPGKLFKLDARLTDPGEHHGARVTSGVKAPSHGQVRAVLTFPFTQ